VIALVACAIEALIAFRVIQPVIGQVRIDAILPLSRVTGGIAWSPVDDKICDHRIGPRFRARRADPAGSGRSTCFR